MLHGLDVGFPPEKIVYDSPVKTLPELSMNELFFFYCRLLFAYFFNNILTFPYAVLAFSLEKGIHINVDNYQELEIITEIIKELG